MAAEFLSSPGAPATQSWLGFIGGLDKTSPIPCRFPRTEIEHLGVLEEVAEPANKLVCADRDCGKLTVGFGPHGESPRDLLVQVSFTPPRGNSPYTVKQMMFHLAKTETIYYRNLWSDLDQSCPANSFSC